MQKRRRISSNSKFNTIASFLLFILAPPLVFIFQDKLSLIDSVLQSLLFWGIAISIILYSETHDQIEYDGANFYVFNWRGEQRDCIPVESISSMIWFRYTYRFYFHTKKGGKSYFTLHPNAGFSPWHLEKELKKINPLFFSTKTGFGFEQLIFHDEDWFK